MFISVKQILGNFLYTIKALSFTILWTLVLTMYLKQCRSIPKATTSIAKGV